MSGTKSAITLTPKQEKFAVGVAAGLNQSDAYRMAYNASGMQPKQVWEEASKLRRKPKVSQRIEELLRAARVQDITNIGREIRRTMDLQQEALPNLPLQLVQKRKWLSLKYSNAPYMLRIILGQNARCSAQWANAVKVATNL